MLQEPIALMGKAVADETQLDGCRHLTLELVDAADTWACTVHLVLDVEGSEHEGEIELDGSADDFWLGTLIDLTATELEDELSLHGVFRSDGGESLELELDEEAAGRFAAQLGPGAAG